ncbi:hypothetical protein C8046_08565 [Serinibacter arcticus]|uniref:Uncharacterized protein n=2 Tax=Serinibacter arcticus TaxID=1655435 RepID=A0A2U1ZUP8_9MICO|nr:hypothetical protein C8046_08565 [Serinibacter arcticus]
MYARFRERHPDVRLVLLPATRPAAGPTATGRARDGDGATEVDLEHALAHAAELLSEVRHSLGIVGSVQERWRSGRPRGSVRAEASCTVTGADLDVDAVTRTLTEQGWQASVTRRTPAAVVDARREDGDLHVVVHDGGALLTLEGASLEVGARRRADLVNPVGVRRG